MAGLPEVVVQRAREVLGSARDGRPAPGGMPEARGVRRGSRRSSTCSEAQDDRGRARPNETNLDRVTPLEALALLGRLKGMAEREK